MASQVEPVPDDVVAVMPMLVCRDVATVLDFCRATFGAAERLRLPGPNGTIAHAALIIGEALVLFEGEFPEVTSRSPTPDGSSPVVIHVYVPDADEAVERAVAAGAKILIPVADQFYGDRSGRVMDPSGHVWLIASRIEAVVDDEGRLDEVKERWQRIEGAPE